VLIETPPKYYDCQYGTMLKDMISNHNILPIGLYRLTNEPKTPMDLTNFLGTEDDWDGEGDIEELKQILHNIPDSFMSRYVFTNPPPETVIRYDDQVRTDNSGSVTINVANKHVFN
jgi:hypothetical protein